jgi:hypothetical protein
MYDMDTGELVGFLDPQRIYQGTYVMDKYYR